MNKAFFICFLFACLGGGFLGASQLWPRESRAERIMWLFSQYCMPPYTQTLEATLDKRLSRWTTSPDTAHWVDDRSASFLRVGVQQCSISTYAPFALSADDAADLRILVDAFAVEQFPELSFDPKPKLGVDALATSWMHGPRHSTQRWGIYSFAYPEQGDSAGSILTFTRPPSQRNKFP